MLRVLPRTFKPVNNLICCKTGLMWVVKRATSLFNSFSSSVARVARFSDLKLENIGLLWRKCLREKCLR